MLTSGSIHRATQDRPGAGPTGVGVDQDGGRFGADRVHVKARDDATLRAEAPGRGLSDAGCRAGHDDDSVVEAAHDLLDHDGVHRAPDGVRERLR